VCVCVCVSGMFLNSAVSEVVVGMLCRQTHPSYVCREASGTETRAMSRGLTTAAATPIRASLCP
jgi:hypothetical protein